MWELLMSVLCGAVRNGGIGLAGSFPIQRGDDEPFDNVGTFLIR